MQAALAKAFAMTTPDGSVMNYQLDVQEDKYKKMATSYEKALETAVCEFPNHGKIVQNLLKYPHDPKKILESCRIQPGIPVKPQLAKPTESIKVIFKRFEGKKFTCEYKYDGLRGQVHFHDNKVTIYSRNLENMTGQYPDIVKFVMENFQHLDSFILDSEIVAVDVKRNRILPFQVLSTRRRKDVVESDITVQVCLYMFDLLYLNGKSLLGE